MRVLSQKQNLYCSFRLTCKLFGQWLYSATRHLWKPVDAAFQQGLADQFSGVKANTAHELFPTSLPANCSISPDFGACTRRLPNLRSRTPVVVLLAPTPPGRGKKDKVVKRDGCPSVSYSDRLHKLAFPG